MRETDSAESYCEEGLDGSAEEGMHGVHGHPDPVGVPSVIFSNRKCREPIIINIDRNVILKRRRADKVSKKARKRNRRIKR